MFTFFRGWRRKLGILTLILACVLTIAWIRSLSVGNMFACGTSRHWVNYLGSLKGVIFIGECGESSIHDVRPPKWFEFPASTRIFETKLVQKYAEWNGFGIYESTFDPKTNPLIGVENVQIKTIERYWTIPYWSIVIPLTLLSAYLLFSKPRVAKSTAVEVKVTSH